MHICAIATSRPKNSRRTIREIALAVRVGIPHLERVVHGIRQYAETRANWRFLVNPETHDLPPTSLKGWDGDGVIALCNSTADVRILRGLNCPVVNISGARRRSSFPRVLNDYREIGRIGASYLRGRGFRRFGFYGVEGLWYSEEIEAGLTKFASHHEIPVQTLHAANPIEGIPRWNDGQDEPDSWLRRMQPPFAVMAAHDPRAAIVIRACERIGLNVPREVAVIGVNDDTLTCEACQPRLTSIDRNGFEVGWQAALTLDRLISARKVPDEYIIAPGEIRERESTNALAIVRPQLADAIRFVETRFHEAIGVEQMADACRKSRRWLEEAFRRELDCSPSDFLRRVRVQNATNLLNNEAGIPLGLLATRCGFSGTRQLNAAFRRETGSTTKVFYHQQKAE